MRRRKARFLAGFAAWFAAVWLLWETPVIYPVKIFVVLLHELGHAAAALATGGAVDGITLTPDEGGACRCPGGSAFLTLSAGYLGSLGWGALLLWLGERTRSARAAMAAVGAAVLLLSLVWVRGVFGLLFGLGFGAALLAGARLLPRRGPGLVLTGLGLTSCLYAILDIKSDVLERPQLSSDARLLAELTGVPTLVWGTAWIGIALGASWWLLRRAFRRA